MVGTKVLVLGGTGPAGICLLRELLHRKHATIAYARNISKIPEDLASNTLLEVVQGELNDSATLSPVVARSSVVVSLLGPDISKATEPTMFSDAYSTLLLHMREHGVRRILAMGTISIVRPEDSFSFLRFLMVTFVRLFATSVYQSIINIASLFDKDAGDVDWTVYRLGMVQGGHEEADWLADREKGSVFAGWVGEKGWTTGVTRGALAKWLVNAVEGDADMWIGKMPAVTMHAG